MQWYYIVLLVLMALLVLSLIPWRIGFSMYINVGQNLGVVAFTLWGVTITCFQLEITESAINIIKRKGKEKQIKFDTLDKDAIFAHYFLVSAFRYIIIRELSIFVEFGKQNDAAFSCLGCGTVLQFLYCFYAVLFGAKGPMCAYMSVDPKVEENKLTFANKITIFCAPIVVLFSILRAIKRVKRTVDIYERITRKQYK